MNIDFLKKFKSVPKIKKEKFDVNVGIYWKFIIFLFFLLVLGSFIFSYYIFNSLSGISDNISKNVNSLKESIHEEKLDDTLEYFKNKEEKSKAIISSPAPVIDPSL